MAAEAASLELVVKVAELLKRAQTDPGVKFEA